MFGPDFYPTPAHIGRVMLGKLENKHARTILEPSAGKGDLAEVIRGKDYYGDRERDVECIEVQPELAAIVRDKGFPLVGFDWLNYSGVSYYDAIIANPPFSNADEHILKMWDFLHAGEIVTLCNIQTLENPCTERRARLARLVQEHGSVENIGQVFTTAERKTDVTVGLIHLTKSAEEDEDLSTLFANISTEQSPNDDIGPEPAAVAIRDNLGNMAAYYDMVTTHMLRAFAELRRAQYYWKAFHSATESSSLLGSHRRDEKDYATIVGMALGNQTAARAEFIRKHRRDAWMRVFSMMDFHKYLDKKQLEQFIREIETNSTIQFTKENIRETAYNVFSQRRKLFEKSVANVFDELTRYYQGNTTGTGGGGDYSGWKSNSSYKVNPKLVFPWGCRYDHDWAQFRTRYDSDMDIYNDLDRVLCVLAGQDFSKCHTIGKALDLKFRYLEGFRERVDRGKQCYKAGWSQSEQQCQSQFFNIRFFQKGTVHLTWRDQGLWEQFNVTAAAGKKWIGDDSR
jgi:hypothetical protein